MIEVIVNPLVVKQVPGANARLQQCARSGDEVPAKTTKNIWTIGDDAAFLGIPVWICPRTFREWGALEKMVAPGFPSGATGRDRTWGRVKTPSRQ